MLLSVLEFALIFFKVQNFGLKNRRYEWRIYTCTFLYIVHVLCNVRCIQRAIHCKKGLSIFPSTDGDGMSLMYQTLHGEGKLDK
jgi:hypothetical protein